MSHMDFDKEIAHLERVIGQIAISDRVVRMPQRIPLSYWRTRVSTLHGDALMPTQRARLARLEAALRSLEQSPEAQTAPRAEPRLRGNGTRS
ncbi:MAG TPA: hypothetical protein VFE79_17565 [Paraburkholderia sp.]|jgi:hypothetical protein|nr:hypothetical protein [Paraburkholderia sp.]